MKILIVGNSKPWSIERYFVKYLKEGGAKVTILGSGDIVYDFHSRNLINKMLFHSKLVTRYPEVNRLLLKTAGSWRPDLIWVFKGMEIYPGTLDKLRKEGFRLANYNPDHPFIITSKGSGNKNVTESVGLYDLHFCYQQQLMSDITSKFNIPCVFLPFAYDPGDMEYMEPSEISEINKLCFQGNPDNYRIHILAMLADAGIPVDVFGHGWNKTTLAEKKGVSVYPIASRSAFWRMNQEYRVQLNLFREYNFGSHNMRTFEIPVVGGIQLTVHSVEQAGFFKDKEEIFFYSDETELVTRAIEILSMNPAKVSEIRTAARKRSLESGYSFRDRSALVLESFKRLCL